MAVSLALQATAAGADTLDRQRYRERLAEVRAALVSARAVPPAARQPLVDRARMLLAGTTALEVEAGIVLAVDDRALAARVAVADGPLDAAIRDVDVLIAAAIRPAAIDPAAADAQLQRLVGEHRVREAQLSLPDLVFRWLSSWLAGVGGAAPDIRIVLTVAGGLGLAFLLLVLGILGRGLRERLRREVVLPELRIARPPDPAEHLRSADAARGRGHLREAIHRLYLYALAALAAREAIRYDPSLTDREVLARARGIPNADALHDLIELHERIWYGLHDARPGDADDARALARRAVA